MDIWIAPTEENKAGFLSTLLCIGYPESEINDIKNEEFSTHFMCILRILPYVIGVLTAVHKTFPLMKRKKMIVHLTDEGIEFRMITYDFLKDIKLRSSRQKYLWGIARLEEVRDMKNKSESTGNPLILTVKPLFKSRRFLPVS